MESNSKLLSWLAPFVVGCLYTTTLLICIPLKWLRSNPRGVKANFNDAGPYDIVCIGTFYNEGWLDAHIAPLLLAKAVNSITIVTDEAFSESESVNFACPSKNQRRFLGRSIARLWICISVGRNLDNPLFMGYHIMPNALIALVSAKLLGVKSIYQMTGGTAQVIGGGYQSENRLLTLLGRPYSILERLLHRIIRMIDIVIVRGKSAHQYVTESIKHSDCHILTGSVDPTRFSPDDSVVKSVDLLFVGRLAEVKGADVFIELASHLYQRNPSLVFGAVGDGPLQSSLHGLVKEKGLGNAFRFFGKQKDVSDYFKNARLFVLLSRSEGMSIAMLEAMMSGVPVAVHDVGDLRDFVIAGDGGILLENLNIELITDQIEQFLSSPKRLQEISRKARLFSLNNFSPNAIAHLWDSIMLPTSSP